MAIPRAKDSKANLCDTCMLHPAECGAIAEFLEYGDGPGNDNVIECPSYHDSFIKLPKPNKIMKPTIGRIVLYKTEVSDMFKMEAAKQINGGCNRAKVLPAVVVAVWSDNCVNLRVIADGNLDLWKTSVVQGDQPGQWNWPVKE